MCLFVRSHVFLFFLSYSLIYVCPTLTKVSKMASVSAGAALGSSSGGISGNIGGNGDGSSDVRSDSGSSSGSSSGGGSGSGSEAPRGDGSRVGVVVGSDPAQAPVEEQRAAEAASAPSNVGQVEHSAGTARSGGHELSVVAEGEHEQQQQQKPAAEEAVLEERLKGGGQHGGDRAAARAGMNREGGDGGDGSHHAGGASGPADGGEEAGVGEQVSAVGAAAGSVEAMIENLPPGFVKCPGCPMVSCFIVRLKLLHDASQRSTTRFLLFMLPQQWATTLCSSSFLLCSSKRLFLQSPTFS